MNDLTPQQQADVILATALAQLGRAQRQLAQLADQLDDQITTAVNERQAKTIVASRVMSFTHAVRLNSAEIDAAVTTLRSKLACCILRERGAQPA
jgi:hypothetical protein